MWLLLLFGVLSPVMALDNGLALIPPMGWMSWLRFGCTTDCVKHPRSCLSEELIKRTADRLVSDGYVDAGYEYVIIDDCWLEKKRGEDGRMVPDRSRFKSGMKAMADYIHSKGLKFGMYQDIGNKTCQGYPGLKNHEQLDVDTFAGWEIDFLKVDGCYEKPADMDKSYPDFGKLLNRTGRPIMYSCSWPAYTDYNKTDYASIAKHCNIWRNYDDIDNSWSSVVSIMDWFGDRPELTTFAGPGHYNDPDMLVIGNSGLTVDQAKVQMAVWSILAGPMLLSTDLDEMKPEFKEIVLNKDVIAVSQSRRGLMGERIHRHDGLEVWHRVVDDGIAVAIVNKNDVYRRVEYTHRDLQLSNFDYEVTDLFKEEKTRILPKNQNLTTMVNPTGVKFYKFVQKIVLDNEISSAWD
ncbi:alpha-N-acetylgalactosaminidase-like [Pectinophora gossypiella]|uniref:alpha-N-acetylgalactosaminidase-like n=1 Tax=Pectinophora gossypiella TaxID=13191 RepID=UPI00214E0D97|nr:alpha-N-acetylgalactosaminidase-like [Pectinophora gossypiella]